MSTLDGKPLMSLRVVDLKVELEKRRLSKSGAKKDLVARLSKFLVDQNEQQPDPQMGVSSPPNVNLAQDISHSDTVQEYLELTQSQFQSALSEKESQGNVECDEGPGRGLEKEEEEMQNNQIEEQMIPEEQKRREEESKLHFKMLEQQKEKERKLQAEELGVGMQRKLQQEQELEKQRLLEERKRQELKERELILEEQKKKEAELQELDRRRKLQQQELDNQRLLEERKRKEEEAGRQFKILDEQKEKGINLKEAGNECKRQKEEVERKMKQGEEEEIELEKKNHLKLELQEKKKIEDEELENRKREKKERKINDEQTENRSAEDSQEGEETRGEVREEEEPKKSQESAGAILKTEDVECDEIVVSTGSPIDGESDISVPPAPAQPPPPSPIKLTFRKMSRTTSGEKTRRQWGARIQSGNSESDAVSGQQLKDVVPDIKPYLEDMNDDDEEDGKEEKVRDIETTCDDITTTLRDVGETRELPLPLVQERPSKTTSTMFENSQRSSIVSIRNLVRPFTIGQLRELLSRTGEIIENGFWMDKIKSHAIVEYSSPYEAEETVMALDGVKWPSVNPKTLSVSFTSKDVFLQVCQGQEVSPPPIKGLETDSRKRRHSESKDENSTKDDVVPLQPSKDEQEALTKRKKNLDDLFRKTKTTPSIYWKPRIEVKN